MAELILKYELHSLIYLQWQCLSWDRNVHLIASYKFHNVHKNNETPKNSWLTGVMKTKVSIFPKALNKVFAKI